MDYRTILKRLFWWNRQPAFTKQEMMGARLAVGNYKSPPREKFVSVISAWNASYAAMAQISALQRSSLMNVSPVSGPTEPVLSTATMPESRKPTKLRIIK